MTAAEFGLTGREGREDHAKVAKEFIKDIFGSPFASFANPSRPSRPEVRFLFPAFPPPV
jgi:hypothetical protein